MTCSRQKASSNNPIFIFSATVTLVMFCLFSVICDGPGYVPLKWKKGNKGLAHNLSDGGVFKIRRAILSILHFFQNYTLCPTLVKGC